MSPRIAPSEPHEVMVGTAWLASATGLHVRTIRRLVREGALPAPVTIGSSRRWPLAVAREIVAGRRPTTARK